MTSASVVSAVGLPSQQPSSTKGVHLDVPCRAGRPPLAATSPSSPLHSPSSISPSQQYTSIRQPSSSPAAHASDGRFLRYTGKVSKCAPYISSRAERVGGHTFDQCRGLTYDKHGDTKVYNESDLQYDLDHAYLEYANACVKVKLPPRPRVDVDTRRLTHVTVRDQYELAAAGHDGSEPTSHKNMLTRSDKAVWMQAEDTELDALEFEHETWGSAVELSRRRMAKNLQEQVCLCGEASFGNAGHGRLSCCTVQSSFGVHGVGRRHCRQGHLCTCNSPRYSQGVLKYLCSRQS